MPGCRDSSHEPRLGRDGREFSVILHPELSFPDFQFVDHVHKLSTEGSWDVQSFTFAHDVRERKIHLGRDTFLNLAQGAFAVI